MNNNNRIAKAEIEIDAPKNRVWDALVTPARIKEYMFGTNVATDWKEGSPITWEGEWEGQRYEDKGVIRKVQPDRLLEYTHFSPLAGRPDKPENYHTVTVELSGHNGYTHVALSQDNNPTEEACAHSAENWKMMLTRMKKLLEKKLRHDP
jgi:uncharacterized protein YndB with AHSA1/START domain